MSSSISITSPYLPLIAIATSGALFGSTLTFSLFAVPALLHPSPAPATATSSPKPTPLPSHSTLTPIARAQFRTLYNAGKKTFPPLGILASAIYSVLSYHDRVTGRGSSGKWAVCAAASVAIVPFTIGIMMPGIQRLMHEDVLEAGSKGRGTEERKRREGGENWVVEEVERWSRLNLVRAVFHGTAMAVGVWAFGERFSA